MADSAWGGGVQTDIWTSISQHDKTVDESLELVTEQEVHIPI